jgi:hypothetical protein
MSLIALTLNIPNDRATDQVLLTLGLPIAHDPGSTSKAGIQIERLVAVLVGRRQKLREILSQPEIPAHSFVLSQTTLTLLSDDMGTFSEIYTPGFKYYFASNNYLCITCDLKSIYEFVLTVSAQSPLQTKRFALHLLELLDGFGLSSIFSNCAQTQENRGPFSFTFYSRKN